MNTGYAQYMRRYRLIVTHPVEHTRTRTVRKTIQTTPEVPATPTTTVWTGVVATKSSNLNYRAGPGTKYKSYGTFKKGTKLEILNRDGSWYTIRARKGENGIAYASGKYIRITGTKEEAGTAGQAATFEEVEETVTETVREDVNALDLSGLRCSFVCEKSATDTPNYSQITVYNLSQKSIASVKAGDTVILEAGYENGNYGMIFTGQIVQPLVRRESGTDIALVLVSQDGDDYLTSAFTAKTLSRSATQADVVAACLADRPDVTQGLINAGLSQTKLPRGKVLFGKSAQYLRQAANGSRSQLYIEDGTVNIVGAEDYAENQAVELNPDTGLIGMPEQTDDGVSGQCLINPSLKLNTLIHIDSSLVTQKQVDEGATDFSTVSASGVYRVVKLTYEGDTHGEPWYQTFEAIAQAGLSPTGIRTGDNPWR